MDEICKLQSLQKDIDDGAIKVIMHACSEEYSQVALFFETIGLNEIITQVESNSNVKLRN